VVSFTPRPLYPQGKSLRYPLDRKLGGLQSQSGHGTEEKNSQPPPGIEPTSPDRPAHSQVDGVTPTVLKRKTFESYFKVIPKHMNSRNEWKHVKFLFQHRTQMLRNL
jgi:hypothetical protein